MTTSETMSDRLTLRDTLLNPKEATGLLLASPTGDIAVPMSDKDRHAATELAGETLAAAGIRHDDRVVIALNNDGDLAGALLAEAVTEIAETVVSVGPRGRMRLITVMAAMGANVLICTPTGAADLLARLHMEFLLDPLDLELRLLVLTGEISDTKTYRHLASEFDTEVAELYTDPVTGIPVAHRAPLREDNLTPVRKRLLDLAEVRRDEPLAGSDTATHGEIVVRHDWHSKLSGAAVRTGHVTTYGDDGAVIAPKHTVGDHILVRGRWLSLTAVGKALSKIDGITQWQFEVSRKGTLDTATLTVTFNRQSLVDNDMWKGRIEQALSALTPVSITVETDPVVHEEPEAPQIIDHRGHHLGERGHSHIDRRGRCGSE